MKNVENMLSDMCACMQLLLVCLFCVHGCESDCEKGVQMGVCDIEVYGSSSSRSTLLLEVILAPTETLHIVSLSQYLQISHACYL